MFGWLRSILNFIKSRLGFAPNPIDTINHENVSLNQNGYSDKEIEAMELEEDLFHEEHDYF